MKTTSVTSEIERFEKWRSRLLEEHKGEEDWQKEIIAFFLDLYMQTYPARSFPLMLELWGVYSPGDEGEGSKDETNTKRSGGSYGYAGGDTPAAT